MSVETVILEPDCSDNTPEDQREKIDERDDIVGLYVNPPDHAVVLSVGEKTQIQVLGRTQSVLADETRTG